MAKPDDEDDTEARDADEGERDDASSADAIDEDGDHEEASDPDDGEPAAKAPSRDKEEEDDEGDEDDDEDDDEGDEEDDGPVIPPGPPRKSRLWLAGIIVVLTLVLDLWSKSWAWHNLREGEAVTVIENWFYFEFGFNTGSAFSLLRDAAWARATFIGVTLIAVAYMTRLAMTLPTKWASAFVAVALVSGGALGNLHDRLVRVTEIRGEERYGVVDFIKIYYWPERVWPTFNVADIALVVGVGLLLIFLTRHSDVLDAQKKKT